MIERGTPTKGDGPRAVTFTLPATGYNGHRVGVVGDFNDWDPAATPPSIRGGNLAATLAPEPGRRYRFRYPTDRGRWFNDHAADDHGADDYADNEFGGQDPDGVLDPTAVGVSA